MNSYFSIERSPAAGTGARSNIVNTRSRDATKAFGLWLWLSVSFVTSVSADESVSFRLHIAPILLDHCAACHSAKKAEGGYRVDTYAELSQMGDSELDPLKPNEDQPAELLRRLITHDEFERMPAESDPLGEAQIQRIAKWIQSGAAFDGDDPALPLPFVIPPPRYPAPPKVYPRALEVTAIAFSPDGNHVLSGGYHEVLVWNLQGELVRRIDNIGQQTYALAFHPNGKQLAVACGQPGRSGEVRLIDYLSGEVSAVVGRSTDVVWDVAYRPGTDELAIAGADKCIHVVNVQTLEEILTLQSHADWVMGIRWTPDGNRLVSASRDKSSKVFDPTSGQLLISYQGHHAAVRGLAVSPDGSHALTVGDDHKLHRWNLSDAKKVAEVELQGDGQQVASVGEWLVVPCSDFRVRKVELTKNTVAAELKGHRDWVLSVAVSPDQTHVASGSYDGEIRVWNARDTTVISSWNVADH